MTTTRNFQVSGKNKSALFKLKLHRGEGMALIAMNWKKGKPPKDFVGFSIAYMEPEGNRFFALNNRLSFADALGNINANTLSTRLSPIQKFRWVHFPRNAELAGEFTYRVIPVFMDPNDVLSYGEPQEVAIQLQRETYPDQLNVTFTRGFVSSQAFVDRYGTKDGSVSSLLPAKAEDGLTFVPTHPKAAEALNWMGFEARHAILEVLDQAISDPTAKVSVVAYDLSSPDVVSRLEQLGARLRIIIDNSGEHNQSNSGENQAEARLLLSAGVENVIRQKMGQLQHNKTIVINGDLVKAVVCGSTNYSWRGFFVQNNNSIVLRGKEPVNIFLAAFDGYWSSGNKPANFYNTGSAVWNDLQLKKIKAQVSFSPHSLKNALLASIAADLDQTKSSLFFSLAFLYQTTGAIREAITKITADSKLFVYGVSDKKVGGMDLLKPDGNIAPVRPEVLGKNAPPPFKPEPSGGMGIRLHHKFLVIDFDKPTARVYMGSYNFSATADRKNGENLLLIQDRRIAVAYMIEALRIVDHYHFRVVQSEAKSAGKGLFLKKPPRNMGEQPWWAEDYINQRKIRDRKLFSQVS